MTGTLAPSRRLLPARRLGTPPPNATIVARTDLGPTMARFSIAPDEGVPAFAPGQYFAIGLELGGRLVQRPYSAASAAGDATLEFLVRLVPGGELTPALWSAGPGRRVRLGPPKGLFRLSEAHDGATLLLGTGTGIAPLVAMARALRGSARPTVLVHGVARVDELAYGEVLASWAGATADRAYVPAISRPADDSNAGWRGRTGRLDAVVPEVLAELELRPAGVMAYLCGSPAMIEGVGASLRELGVPAHAIRSEAF